MDSIVDIELQEGIPVDSPWGDTGRDLALCLVSLTSKVLLCVLNTTTVVHGETMQREVMERPKEVGLLTVCNHTRSAHDGRDAALNAGIDMPSARRTPDPALPLAAQ